MESPEQKQIRVDKERELISGLATMRDTLNNLSLILNDLKFEADTEQRQLASEQAAQCIARSQSHQA
jgi:hypothetical protein